MERVLSSGPLGQAASPAYFFSNPPYPPPYDINRGEPPVLQQASQEMRWARSPSGEKERCKYLFPTCLV